MNAGLIKENPVLSFIRDKPGKANTDNAPSESLIVPDSSRFTRIVLAQGFDEPLGMAILPNNDVLLAERKGSVKIYNRISKQVKVISNLDVFSGIEDGLLGIAIDPNFSKNRWVYFYYALAGDRAVNRLSRFELLGDVLFQNSEKVLLEIPTQRKYCCHSGGYISFDSNGLLYLSTGDNTNAEETEGYTPVDERPGRALADDQGTAANTNDLRGKILRIRPLDNGTYTIPDGNLFPQGNPKSRPEIYIMGSRNPYRFSVDRKNNYLYWGDVGPDTKVMGTEGELMSYDEINQARKSGFYGWPYFLGNNQAFPKYDFEARTLGPKKDPANPINNSPNNTGERVLPPAQPAMIWIRSGFYGMRGGPPTPRKRHVCNKRVYTECLPRTRSNPRHTHHLQTPAQRWKRPACQAHWWLQTG
jgi:cytochrome c